MKSGPDSRSPAVLTALAFVLWFLAFAFPPGNFWVKISLSAAILASLSLVIRRGMPAEIRFDRRALLLGLAAAGALYGIFALGRVFSINLFGFADGQISEIYRKGAGTPGWVISLLLFFVTGPGEEVFWRGFLQRELQGRFGEWRGYIFATALYACVHVSSMNFMLIGAAAVAGAFWGLFYWRTNNLAAAILSHSIWSTFIFTVMPLG